MGLSTFLLVQSRSYKTVVADLDPKGTIRGTGGVSRLDTALLKDAELEENKGEAAEEERIDSGDPTHIP